MQAVSSSCAICDAGVEMLDTALGWLKAVMQG
jgi:hypothetical protein